MKLDEGVRLVFSKKEVITKYSFFFFFFFFFLNQETEKWLYLLLAVRFPLFDFSQNIDLSL